jgi:amidase
MCRPMAAFSSLLDLHPARTGIFIGDTAALREGAPAMSVPLHWAADGLPVGVHSAGRYGEKATLLALAALLETAQPWFDRVAGAVKGRPAYLLEER